MVELKIPSKITGHGKLTIKRQNGETEEYNHIDQLLASFFTKAYTGNVFNVFPRLKVGTGTTPNSPETTQLTTVLPPVSGVWPAFKNPFGGPGTVVEGGTKIHAYVSYEFLAGVGQFVGEVSEYGLLLTDDTTVNGVVDTRVLITDIEGNPRSITLGAYDQLMCVYTLEILVPRQDIVSTITGTVEGEPTDFEVTMRHAEIGSFTTYMNLSHFNQAGQQTVFLTQDEIGEIGTPLPPSNGPTQDNYLGEAVIGDGTKRRLHVEIPMAKGNFVEGIRGVAIGGDKSWYKIGFTPVLPKAPNNTIKFTLNLTYTQ